MNNNVKKVFLLVLLLSLTLFIGCKSDKDLGNKGSADKDLGDEYIEGCDAQYMFMGHGDSNYIMKSENGYYFISDIYVYYCDFNTMEPKVLCNKPDCLHDKELDETKKHECNGAVGSIIDGLEFLGIYDNHLYCYSGDDIIKISLDGSNVNKEFELGANVTFMTLHRDKIYYVTETVIDKDKGIYKAILNQRDISSENSEVKEITSIEDVGANISSVIPKGNKIIYNKSHFDENNGDISSVEVYDFKSKEITSVGSDVTDDELGFTSISDNSIIFIPRKNVNDTVVLDENVYSFDLDTNKSSVLFKRGFEDIIFYSDDKYIYSDNILQVFKDDEGNCERKLGIYDKEGKEIETIDLSELKYDFSYFLSGDEKYMFINGRNEEGSYIKYIDKSKIGTGTAKLETMFLLESEYLNSILVTP